MASYAIGDIQGCFRSLKKLLKKIEFDPEVDTLWLAGDLVNRGPDSLKVLEFAYKYRKNIRCVLGNHDLHFLAVESGQHKASNKDTFHEILASPQRHKLVDWLTGQPLIIYDQNLGFAMSHAGIYPGWTLQQALALGQEVSDCLTSDKRDKFFSVMYGNKPSRWKAKSSGMARLRFITNALTRMRYCDHDGRLELHCKLPPGKQPAKLVPWYELNAEAIPCNLVFGHWASLQGDCKIPHLFALDTGCVWGGRLTALRLDDLTLFSCKSKEKRHDG